MWFISFSLLVALACTSALSTKIEANSTKTSDGTDSANTAATYRRALILERRIRQPRSAPIDLEAYRQAIERYREIADQHSRSAYAAHALWHAAGLHLTAYEHTHTKTDRDIGLHLLLRLQRDYPNSTLATRVDEQRRLFNSIEPNRRLVGVRKHRINNIERVTLELDGSVIFRIQHLENPSRLLFVLSSTDVDPSLQRADFVFSDSTVRNIQVNPRRDDTTHVALNVPRTHDCNILALYDPFRIVADCPTQIPNIDISEQIMLESNLAPSVANPKLPRMDSISDIPKLRSNQGEHTIVPLARQLGLGISRVVIDPGHGGRDPGAIANNLEEANLVFDISNRLAMRLTQYGIETVLTRRNDQYLPLEARTMLANRVNGDLFLSIHANASTHPGARGVETYILDYARSDSASTTASRENRTGSSTLQHLDGLVRAIGTTTKESESRTFAELVQQKLVRKLRRVDPQLPDLGVKTAPFVVLIGARIPSVLAEVSFLTNEKDARLLATDTYRALVADALLEAILGYRNVLKPTLPNETATSIAGELN